jgi:hypothetical protein
MELDTTQEIVGTVKQMEATIKKYDYKKNDTIVSKTNVTIFFDSKNNMIRQIYKHPKYTNETICQYNRDNLLESIIIKSKDRITKVEHKYDKKRNLIEYRQFENDTLNFIRTTIYNDANNPVQKTSNNLRNPKYSGVEEYTYNKKERSVSIRSFKKDDKTKKGYFKEYFDKKGYMIKTQSVSSDSDNNSRGESIMEYDKNGNLSKRVKLDENGNPRDITTYKNSYDEIGNIISREKRINNQLVETTNFEITYR